jgi:ribosomal protein L11 methyltransferase
MSFLVKITGPCSLIEHLYPHLEKRIARITCHNFQGRNQATICIDLDGPSSLVDFKLLQLEDYLEKMLQGNPFPPELKIEVGNKLNAEPFGIEEYFRESFQPIPDLTIVPWHSPEPAVPDQKTIYLNPGAAFGSGRHPSTRLSLSLLEEGIKYGSSKGKKIDLLDVGCGSGILGIAAIIFGADRALGIETDPEAVSTAKKNAILNGLADRLLFERGSLEKINEHFDIIVANLVPSVGSKLRPEMIRHLKNRGLLITAGFQNGLLARVLEQLDILGLTVLQTREEKGWSAVMAQRERDA